jgi:hypothetical protein
MFQERDFVPSVSTKRVAKCTPEKFWHKENLYLRALRRLQRILEKGEAGEAKVTDGALFSPAFQGLKRGLKDNLLTSEPFWENALKLIFPISCEKPQKNESVAKSIMCESGTKWWTYDIRIRQSKIVLWCPIRGCMGIAVVAEAFWNLHEFLL